MVSKSSIVGLVFAGLLCSNSSAAVRFQNCGERPVRLAVAFEHGGKWIKYGWNTIAPGETRRLNSNVRGTILYFAKDAETQEDVGRASDPFSGRRTTLPAESRFVATWQTPLGESTHEFRVLRNSELQVVVIGQATVVAQPIQTPVTTGRPSIGPQTPGQESNSFEWLLDADIQADVAPADITSDKTTLAPQPAKPKSQSSALSESKPGLPMATDDVPNPTSTRTLDLYVE